MYTMNIGARMEIFQAAQCVPHRDLLISLWALRNAMARKARLDRERAPKLTLVK